MRMCVYMCMYIYIKNRKFTPVPPIPNPACQGFNLVFSVSMLVTSCSHLTSAPAPWATGSFPPPPHIDVDARLSCPHLMAFVLNIQKRKGREEQGET